MLGNNIIPLQLLGEKWENIIFRKKVNQNTSLSFNQKESAPSGRNVPVTTDGSVALNILLKSSTFYRSSQFYKFQDE